MAFKGSSYVMSHVFEHSTAIMLSRVTLLHRLDSVLSQGDAVPSRGCHHLEGVLNALDLWQKRHTLGKHRLDGRHKLCSSKHTQF